MTTTVHIPPIRPNGIPEERYAQNGDVPSQAALRRAAWAYNHASVHQRKVLFLGCYDTQATYTPATATETTVYFSFRTGENVESVRFFVGLAPATQANGTAQAYVQGKIYDGTTLLSAPEMYYPKVQLGAFQQSEVAWAKSEITIADGLLPNTDYCGYLNQINYSRIHSVMVHETALSTGVSSVTGITDPKPWETNKPIYDAAVQGLAETGTKLWQHNGRPLISIGRDDSTTTRTVNSISYQNFDDAGTSAWSASAPGYMVNTLYHDTSSGDVPIEIACRCRRTAGSGSLFIRLVQDGITLFTTEFTGPNVSPHALATATIPAFDSTKTDILVAASLGTTYEIDSLAIWEYEA